MAQALAFLLTGNEQYARNSIDIAHSWAISNEIFGPKHQNGPLESAWFLASVLKGLELLRYTWKPGYWTYKVGGSSFLRTNLKPSCMGQQTMPARLNTSRPAGLCFKGDCTKQFYFSSAATSLEMLRDGFGVIDTD
jgi:hypothetical protein